MHDATASRTRQTHAEEGPPPVDMRRAARRIHKREVHPPAGRAPWVAIPIRCLEVVEVVQVPASVVLQCHHWRGQRLEQLLVFHHKFGVRVCGMVLHKQQKLCPDAAGPLLQGVDGTIPAGCRASSPHHHSAFGPVARCCTEARVLAQPFGICIHSMVLHRKQCFPQAAWQPCPRSSWCVRNALHAAGQTTLG